MNENNTAAQTTTETQSEVNGAQSERTFTQEEVNAIVKERLAKERTRSERAQQEQDDQAQKELTARENRLTCREFLIDRNYPKELLDCVDTSNPDEFKVKAETIYNAISRNSCKSSTSTPRFMASEHASSPLDEAFGRDVKHKPKRF